jgi:hypothetical protein
MGKRSQLKYTDLTKEERENLAISGQRENLNTKRRGAQHSKMLQMSPAVFKGALLEFLDKLNHGEIDVEKYLGSRA